MKYPKGIKEIPSSKNMPISQGNRGMNLEKEINDSNSYYREKEIAWIYKKPTPIKITKVSYPDRTSKVIKEAYFDTPSTTDYNGLYKGRYIDFEAKETKNKTAFPLKNIHQHQLIHLKSCMNHGGICFLIVRFTEQLETYVLFGKELFSFLEDKKRSSIPRDYFKEKGYRIKEKYLPRIDYLEIVEQIYGGVLDDK